MSYMKYKAIERMNKEEQTRYLLDELFELVKGECPSLLNEDSGGDGELALCIEDVLAPVAVDDRGPRDGDPEGY